ncbi:MAG TPA: hypothetical protein VG055_21445 [Planctomycetaceae bacterium]|jgi:hypothetical protein|nr:hypothetical protein [Planctomycetaceae bacterium]
MRDGMHCVPAEAVGLFFLLVVLSFTLFMLLSRDLIRAIARRWESRPTWTEKDEAELRNLMRSEPLE